MADGFNAARATRVTEILRDYQDIQGRIAAYRVNVPSSAQNEAGYTVLRQCQAEARSLLNQAYPVEVLHPPTGAGEAQKRQLQRVIVDASARRLRAQKIFLKATAAMKWIQRRAQIVPGGQVPSQSHRSALQQAENAMRAEIAQATNQRIITAFRTRDQQNACWTNDDPLLQTLQIWIANNGGG